MFIDASAVIAILKAEPGFDALTKQATSSQTALLYSPLSRFEAVVGLARSNAGTHRSSSLQQIEDAKELVDSLFSQLGATNVDLTETTGAEALTAAKTYGRAVGHPAALNLGDCFAYACAKERRVGLLYKGGDFAETDLG
jgi:ribonuclease VapC